MCPKITKNLPKLQKSQIYFRQRLPFSKILLDRRPLGFFFEFRKSWERAILGARSREAHLQHEHGEYKARTTWDQAIFKNSHDRDVARLHP